MPPKPELPSEVFQARTGQVPDPNRDIIAKEDHLINHPSAQQRTELAEYLSTVNLNAASTGSDVGRVLNYPTRPGYADGIPGKNFTLFTNHFKMTFDKSLEIHRYNISVTHLGRQNDSPDILREERQPHGDNLKDPVGKKLRRVVQLFIQEGPLASQRSSLASNFTTLVLSPKQLSAQLLSGHVRYRDDDARTPGTVHDVYDVHLTLAPGPTLSMSALQDYLDTATSRYSSSSYEGFKEALNIVLGHYPKSQTDDRIMSIGQQHYNTYNHHNQHHSLPIGQGLRAYRGFMISARLSAGCMLAQVQIKHVAVYKPINLYDMLHEYGFSDRPALSNFIRGLRVKITYLGGTRIRTVTGLAMKSDNDPKNGQAPKVEADGAYTNQVEVWTDDSKNETPKQGSSKQAASKQAASKQKQVSQQNSGPKQDASSSSQGSSGKRINLYTYFEGSK